MTSKSSPPSYAQKPRLFSVEVEQASNSKPSLRAGWRITPPSVSPSCDNVKPTVSGCPDGSCGVKLLAKLCFLILLCPFVSLAATDVPLVLQHVTVIDGTGSEPQPDRTIVISGGRITAIGPTGRIKIDKTANVIDARGKFLIPGFWDMHVHLAGINADPAWSKDVLLPLLIANGITGVRDMGGDLETLLSWKRAVEAGSLLGPHLYVSGPWLAAGGRKTPEQLPVANAEQARAAVRDLKQRGADFIKIISLPSRETFFAVTDEAKKQNISFAGHLPFEIGAAEASNAGMRSIEHFLYSAFALSFSSQEEDLRKQLVEAEKKGDSDVWEKIAQQADATFSAEKAAALFQTLKKNGTWVTPTIASLDITSHPDAWKLDDPYLDFVPPSLAKEWRSSFNDARMKQRAAWLGRQAANDWQLAGELHRAGVPLLAGSDSLDPFVFPGDSLHRELAEFIQAGYTPVEVIQAATQGAARFVGREKELGTVEEGKIADLVLLDANPLENISNTRKILAVIRNGQYLNRGALDGLLAKAKSAAAAMPPEK
jgi:imidazolonepropionase-like amidohydrolase